MQTIVEILPLFNKTIAEVAQLALLENGFALGDEGIPTFTLIVRAEQRVEVAAFDGHAVLQRRLEGQIHQLLDQQHRGGR